MGNRFRPISSINKERAPQRCRGKEMKKIIWKVTGRNLGTLFIEADSFDSAIEKARNVNKNYCSGQVVRNENK